MTGRADGPLAGVRVLELGGIGPVPFAAMLLADAGAEVIRVDRPGEGPGLSAALHRGRRAVAVDLKDPRGAAVVRRLAETVDVLLEGFRPGVCERLGLGPDELRAGNPRLVYARMTGWGQSGPLAQAAGHDINYLALTGALHAIGPAGGDPVPPLNLVADFGGGGALLAYGVLCALLRARLDGVGQVVDAAMVDGAAQLLTMTYGFLGLGVWRDSRGGNILDGGAPFYRSYRCADDRHVAVGAIEAEFYARLLAGLGLAGDPTFADQFDPAGWPAQHRRLEAVFAGRTRDEWAARFAGVDACVTPVLSLLEAPQHAHHTARDSYHRRADGTVTPAPAPRYSATPTRLPDPAPAPGADTRAVLAEAGYPPSELDDLHAAGVIGWPPDDLPAGQLSG